MHRKTLPSSLVATGERTARFVISDESVDRTQEVVVQSGGDFSLFLQNPIVLYGHDPMSPIGTASNIRRDGTKTIADLTLAPPGVSQKADETWGLIKAGILKSTSIGFDATDVEPMDPARPRGPLRYKKWSLCEISVVAIPAQTKATLIDATNAKAHNGDRAARMRKAADALAKGLRAEKAWQQVQKGFPTAAQLAATLPHPVDTMTAAERRSYAQTVISRNAPPTPQTPPTLYEAESRRAAAHAAAVGGHAQANSKSARVIRAGRLVAPHGRIGGLGSL